MPEDDENTVLASTSVVGDIATDTREEAVVFGTDVAIHQVRTDFLDFFYNFYAGEASSGSYLRNLLLDAFTSKSIFIDIDAEMFMLFNDSSVKLYRTLVAYPQELLPVLEQEVNQEFEKLFNEENARLKVRLFNLRSKHEMRSLSPDQIDTLVSVTGMVIRCSEIIPEMKAGEFQCSGCRDFKKMPLSNSRISEPENCEKCGMKNSFKLNHNQSDFFDMQRIKLQETVEEVLEGETPISLTILVYEEMVNSVKPGDRVEISGILKTRGVRINPAQRVVSTVFANYIDAVHIQKLTRKRDDDTHIAPQTQKQKKIDFFNQLSKQPDVYDILSRSIAPSIFGLEDIKKGILCLLFGGTNSADAELSTSTDEDGENISNLNNLVGRQDVKKTRGEINILLCGDPGLGKSQLLSFVHEVAPRGIYTSGKGSSAVGLTAYISKDPETGEAVLESGALVLSDRGIICLDEFEKMNESTQSALHEVMEQQTISIAKAGIITSLNARTSILASANPLQSKYNPKLSVVSNINLPPTLLSRFDLIFLLLDKVEEDADRKLASHIVKLFSAVSVEEDGNSEDVSETIFTLDNLQTQSESIFSAYNTRELLQKARLDKTLLAEYVAYSKETCFPLITQEAKEELVKKYVEMRRAGAVYGSNNVGRKTISATTRQLESLVRLSESLARMRLCKEVSRQNVDEAVRLMQEATQKAAVDPKTGVIDMDAINTGVGFSDRKDLEDMAGELEKILAEGKTSFSIYELRKELESSSGKQLGQMMVRQAVDYLVDQDRCKLDPRSSKVSIK